MKIGLPEIHDPFSPVGPKGMFVLCLHFSINLMLILFTFSAVLAQLIWGIP